MKSHIFFFLLLVLASHNTLCAQRMPAYPLLTNDPYFSIWSCTDTLTDQNTQHWSGREMPILGLVRINGKAYRFIGKADDKASKSAIPALPMKGERPEHSPFTTFYTYEMDSVTIFVTFRSPLLPDDVHVMARPISYIEITGISKAKTAKKIDLYLGLSSDLVLSSANQKVKAEPFGTSGLKVLRMGNAKQAPLQTPGDQVSANCGHLYIAAADSAEQSISSMETAIQDFVSKASIKNNPKLSKHLVINTVLHFNTSGSRTFRADFMLAYDEQYAVEYFGEMYKPYWKYDNYGGMEELLRKGWHEHNAIKMRCESYTTSLRSRLESVGGVEYWYLCERAFRQIMASHKLVKSPFGEVYLLAKANGGGGFTNKIQDVYDSAPFFLTLNPRLMHALLDPIFHCAEQKDWPNPFPPNDLGIYPKVNGQAGSEEQPIDQCASMLILTAALCRAEGYDQYAKDHWPMLKKWAETLQQNIVAMEDRKETNVKTINERVPWSTATSLKAIIALKAFCNMAQRVDDEKTCEKLKPLITMLIDIWKGTAIEQDHTRMMFAKRQSWSLKEDMIWDKLLNINLLDSVDYVREANFMQTKFERFGVPSNSAGIAGNIKTAYWVALLADREECFKAVMRIHGNQIDHTLHREPLSGIYDTKTGMPISGKAGASLGGIYLQALAAKWQIK